MGLFGTVVGMIEIFGAQNAAGTNPAQLAHGISIALYNTGFGLLIGHADIDFLPSFQGTGRQFPDRDGKTVGTVGGCNLFFPPYLIERRGS